MRNKSLLYRISQIYLFLFSIFLNQLITAVVLFHCCGCNWFRNTFLMFWRITLLILTISFFAGLMSLAIALFSKFGLWSFNVTKHSSLPLTSILSRMFFLLAFFTLLVDGFSDVGICFLVGLGNKIVEKLPVFLFDYFIKTGCLISRRQWCNLIIS